MSFFASVALAPSDPILGLTDAWMADPRSPKVNLGVGVYYDEQGRQRLPDAVRRAEEALVAQHRARGYIPIDGLPAYDAATQSLLFGFDSPLIAAGRVVTAQTLGGTGALRVGADFLKAVMPHATVAISQPSWPNHEVLFRAAGFDIVGYPYYRPATHGVDFEAMCDALETLAPGTVVLLHACCHNPTGADLDLAQWQQVAALLRERRLVPFVDLAYQGFDRGIAEDAEGIAVLLDAGIGTLIIANSYSKSFSLYGERVGALSLVCADADEAARVRSQVKQTIRAIYSNPPTHGAALVAQVLNSTELRSLWESELAVMRERIKTMRQGLVSRLAALGRPEFAFINRQAGMFSYSGLSRTQVARLRDEFAIYAVDSGRICISALNGSNLDYVAAAIAQVTE
ncbi:aspartate/tyrosine/aromatic aminotransferase [Xanthomonadaceae bacterium JHOS43]|nr:aspartate/tyrosine/aromatic aminotransferase [Xanthomonadaceae bacterium JHOS43]MCX7563465.1 aspartate/tyrosine/aromatic aminotransferase [Xanthomonadaceae bacterium XH05]